MSKHILVAEDHPDFRRLLVKRLKKAGYHCVAVRNGQAALGTFKKESFDLIIMDGSMPVMDGFTASKEIRRYEQDHNRKRVPIILYSALTGSDVWRHCVESGIDSFVPKGENRKLLGHIKQLTTSYP